MPITSGHGNPDWTREETILAMDLLVRHGLQPLNMTDPSVEELSELVIRLPIHPAKARSQTFRNPAGVELKLKNLLACGKRKGLRTVAMERAIWDEFHDKPNELAAVAQSIRAAGELLSASSGAEDSTDDGITEGGLRMRAHLHCERARGLRRKLIAKTRQWGELCCEACGFESRQQKQELEESQFEVHHLVPLAEAGLRKTKLADLSLLCANCHRLVHAAMRLEQRGVSLADLRVLAGCL